MPDPLSVLWKKFADHLGAFAKMSNRHAKEAARLDELHRKMNGRLLRVELELIFQKRFLFAMIEPDHQEEVLKEYTEMFEDYMDQQMLDLEKRSGQADAALLDSYLRPPESPDPSAPPSEPPAPEKPA